jgi:NAD(P)H-dependent flavin oxidoreductase YrpB (nitropropane dioxygenase family)
MIAQGTEAGGHRATFTSVDISMQPGLFSLLPQVVDAVKVPVIAAGGVADGRTAAAAFMLGASAVQIGTAFLHCEEAEVREAHRAALAAADDACTVVTDVISGRPCRYIRNKLVDDLVASGLQPPPGPGATESYREARRRGRSRVDGSDGRPIGGALNGNESRRTGRAPGRRDDAAPARVCLTSQQHSNKLPCNPVVTADGKTQSWS